MEIFFFWFFMSVAVGTYAEKKGRSGIGFWLLSMLLSPVIGLVFALAAENRKSQPGEPSPDTHLKCPDCREYVLKDANVCKHCGVKLIPQT